MPMKPLSEYAMIRITNQKGLHVSLKKRSVFLFLLAAVIVTLIYALQSPEGKKYIHDVECGTSETGQNAAVALSDKGNRSAVPALIKALKNKDEDVRTRAAVALGKIGDKTALGALTCVAKSDEKEKVRDAAREAMNNCSILK